MPEVEDSVDFCCGYCGEVSSIDVDPTGGYEQTYVEDCPVCCRPNRICAWFSEKLDDYVVQATPEV